MRYATWNISFVDNATEGTTPEPMIRSKGGQTFGILNINETKILGQISDNSDLTGLEKWQVVEITQQEALDIALSFDSRFTLDNDGSIYAPIKTQDWDSLTIS